MANLDADHSDSSTSKNLVSHTSLTSLTSLEKLVFWITIELIVVFIWALNCNQVASNDTWWHLELGRWMVTEMSMIHHDIYSSILNGKSFVAYEWLSQVIFYLTANPDGSSLTYLKIAIMMIGSLGCGYALLRNRWNGAATLPLVVAMCYLLAFRAQVRPHLFGMWGLALTMTLLSLWRDRAHKKYLWPLIPIFVFWANAHGSYLIGIAILLMVLIVLWAQHLIPALNAWSDKPLDRQALATFSLFAMLAILATLLNPYHVHLWIKSWGVVNDGGFLRDHIREWTSIYHVRPGEYWVMVWTALVSCGWLLFFINAKHRSLLDLCFLALATALPFAGIRHVTASAIIAFPTIIKYSYDLWPQSTAKKSLVSVSGLILALTYTGIHGNTYSSQEHKGIGIGFDYDKIPMDIIEYMKSNKLTGSMMNHYVDGAYVIYFLYPAVRPSMDSRTDLYGEALYKEHQQAYKSPEAMFAYVEKYKLNFIMIKLDPQYQALRAALISHPQWNVAKVGRNRTLFARADISLPNLQASQSDPKAANQAQIEAPHQVQAPVDPKICAIGKSLGHCKQLKGCDSYCEKSEQEIGQLIGLKNSWCLKFSRTCNTEQTACINCQDLCSIYAETISYINSTLSFAYPPAFQCK